MHPQYTDAIGIVVENKYERRRSLGRRLLGDFVFGVVTGVTAGLVIKVFWPNAE